MSSEPAPEKRMIALMSSDCETFVVKEAVAMKIGAVKSLIENDCVDGAIPLSNVKARVLSKVIEYCKKHVESGNNEEEVRAWDKKFVDVDVDMLIDLIETAKILNINSLLDLTSKTVADIMMNNTPEEIRTIFKIKHDLTPVEEEEIRRDYPWAFY